MSNLLQAVLLMGPTATGKTELALKLAEIYPIEIISVDSALIYQDMNIGTAKPSTAELFHVKHHLIDILTPMDTYSVAEFIQSTVKLIDQIVERGHLPVLVGGTMMYYNALINGISQLPKANAPIRSTLYKKAQINGWNNLYEELKQVDILASSKIKPNDSQRIIRALEVYYLTGKPISQLQQQNKLNLFDNIDFLPLAIVPENREVLHQRINSRLDNMLNIGFIQEVKDLQQKYPLLTCTHSSQRSVGYYQIWQYLNQQINEVELALLAKAATRQLAKRQITWLRSMQVIPLNKTNNDSEDLTIKFLFKQLTNYIAKWNKIKF